MVRDAREPLGGVGEPGTTGKICIQVIITVRQYIQPGRLLIADDRANRVGKLLAESDIRHCRRERLPVEITRVPRGAWPGTRDSRRYYYVFGRCIHRSGFSLIDLLLQN
jgi:hypothetical protein